MLGSSSVAAQLAASQEGLWVSESVECQPTFRRNISPPSSGLNKSSRIPPWKQVGHLPILAGSTMNPGGQLHHSYHEITFSFQQGKVIRRPFFNKFTSLYDFRILRCKSLLLPPQKFAVAAKLVNDLCRRSLFPANCTLDKIHASQEESTHKHTSSICQLRNKLRVQHLWAHVIAREGKVPSVQQDRAGIAQRRIGWAGFDPWQRQGIVLFSTASRPLLGLTRPPIQ
jgi:hypothetical protein